MATARKHWLLATMAVCGTAPLVSPSPATTTLTMGNTHNMLRDIKFIALFSLFVLPLFLLLGISGLVAILLASSVCAIAAEWLVKRTSRGAPRGDRKWLSIFLCAGISAAIAGLALTARVHLLVIAISVSGSPYDAPVINTPKLFFIFWGAVFVSVTAVLAVLRRKKATLHHEK